MCRACQTPVARTLHMVTNTATHPHVHTRAHARIHRHTPHRHLAPTGTHAGTRVSYADLSGAHTHSHVHPPHTDVTCIHAYTPQCGLSSRTRTRIRTRTHTDSLPTQARAQGLGPLRGHGGEAEQGRRTKQPEESGLRGAQLRGCQGF